MATVLDTDQNMAVRSRALAEAFRPFRVTAASPHDQPQLDEEATAEQAAHDGLWMPVLKEARERLLDVDVVLDDGCLAKLHRER
jgi:hypothetical protein